ncbi:MAG TPA: hypothetical protein DD761_12405, partial [Cyanobacteria bacterium UBA11691]|nr:hypothetical protein [Cyanobacteria bacterium UBA11691]
MAFITAESTLSVEALTFVKVNYEAELQAHFNLSVSELSDRQIAEFALEISATIPALGQAIISVDAQAQGSITGTLANGQILIGAGGEDTLVGGNGNDVLIGGSGKSSRGTGTGRTGTGTGRTGTGTGRTGS